MPLRGKCNRLAQAFVLGVLILSSAQKGHRKYAVLRQFMASSMHAIYELYALLNKVLS